MIPMTGRLALLAAAALLTGAPCLAGRCLPAAVAGPQEAAAGGEEAKAAGTTFHFGTFAARTNILFESETTVETIHGVTHTMKGTAVLDFGKGTGTADFTVPVASLRTGIETRDEHLRSEDWLHAEKFPDIAFRAKALKRVKSDEKTARETWAYEGSLTIRGVTRDLKGEATVQKIPGDLGRKLGPGAWVKVKTGFQVAIREFGIEVPEVAAAKVNPVWDVTIDIFGTTEAPK